MCSGYSCGSVDLSVMTDIVVIYVKSQGGSRFSIINIYFDNSGRGKLPDFLVCCYLHKTIFPKWSQSFSFKYKEVRNMKYTSHVGCTFYIRV